MKNYNKMMLLSLLLYLFIALLSGFMVLRYDIEKQNIHHVEINRIYAELTKVEQIENFDLAKYQSIQAIKYLDIGTSDEERVKHFFLNENSMSMLIEPWYEGHELKGYIKFIYTMNRQDTYQMMGIIQGGLLVLEITILVFMMYIKKNIMIPFHQLSELPEQFAQGHLQGTVKVEKSKYFHNYLWSMSQLKDTLEITTKRQYELMKEKKQLLLSLSHDIKTPLNLIKLYDKALEENLYENELDKHNALLQIKNKCDEIEAYIDIIIKSSKEDILAIHVEDGEFYLADLIRNVMNVYSEQCRIYHIHCTIGEYSNRLLKGDIHRAKEVLENLFENAFKYGDGKKIDITFYEEDYCQLIRFYNTGCTLSDNEMNHLFDSFFRGSNAQGKQGSGLGLYICQQLMRKMDGEIYADKWLVGMACVLVVR